METNRDRIKYLRTRIGSLGEEIQKKDLQLDYEKMLERISTNPADFVQVSDDEWDVMLPVERDHKLLNYYHTCRLELKSLTVQVKPGPVEAVRSFLEKPYVKTAIDLATLTATAAELLELAHKAGLFVHEGRNEDDIV